MSSVSKWWIVRLIKSVIERWSQWFSDGVSDWLIVWWSNWMFESVNWLTEWWKEWFSQSLIDWLLIDWLIDWLIEWMIESYILEIDMSWHEVEEECVQPADGPPLHHSGSRHKWVNRRRWVNQGQGALLRS